MKRLTTNRSWEEANEDLENELGYSHIWKRLNAIENILFNEVRGNGWNEYPVRVECHAHRKCLQTAIEVMKKQKEEKTT